VVPVPHTAKGRQEKTFSESSERSRRRKTEGLRKTTSTEEMSFATAMSLRGSGNPSAAKLIHEAVTATPTRASKICQSGSEKKGGTAMWKYSEDEALCLLIDAQLSKRQYTTIRLEAKAKRAEIYPAYNNVRAAKERCYPDPVTATGSGCQVGLQALLDITARRLLLVQEGVVGTVVNYDGETTNFVLVSKWGCDGSTGHSQYKQNASSENLSDSNLFFRP
jgi:hypothetical protein